MTLALCLGCQSSPWWYCMMDTYLPVFLSIKDPDQISNCICKNATPELAGNLHHASLLPATLNIVQFPSPSAKTPNRFLLQPNILIWTHQSRTPATIFMHPSPYVFVQSWITWPCFHVGRMAGPTAISEVMALLDIFQFQTEISLMCLWPTTAQLIFNQPKKDSAFILMRAE